MSVLNGFRLIIKNGIKKYLKDKGFHASREIFDSGELEKKIIILLDNACYRADQSKRKTIFNRDL